MTNKPTTLSEQTFVDEICASYKSNPDTNFIFFLGAGCSHSSKIPTTKELVEEWLTKLRDEQKTKYDQLKQELGLEDDDLQKSEHYFQVFEKSFPAEIDQQKEIKRLCENKKPSFGYYMLANLMQKKTFNTIITTNFDDLIFDALVFSGSKHRPLIIGHHNISHLIERNDTPMIIKVHGDAHLQPLNTETNTDELPTALIENLVPILNNTKIVFMGYSGNDKSVVSLLKKCSKIQGVYWLSRSENAPTGEIKSWWADDSSTMKTLVSYQGFDELMVLMKNKFQLDEPDFDSFTEQLKQSYKKDKKVEIKKTIQDNPNPKSDENYFVLGLLHYETSNYQEAIKAYKQAITIKPDKYEAYNNMGAAYHELKEHENAINAYKQAIEIKPDDYEAYYNMGNAHDELEEYQSAIEAYKKAIAIKPDKHEAYYNMGIVHSKLGEYQNAINAYKQAIAIKPDKSEAYVNLFELQLLKEQSFDKNLVQQFKKYCSADKVAEMRFTILNIFKSINDNKVNNNWQEEFSATYQNMSFSGWSWAELKKWINTKTDINTKQALKDALAFFKAFGK